MYSLKEDIAQACKQIGLADSQAEYLWQALQEVQSKKPKANFSTILLYFGAMIALLSMTWFYTAHLNSNKSLILWIIYALIFFGLGVYFWYVKKFRLPGGLLTSLGIVMIPLTVYSFQNLLNWWSPSSPDGYKGFYYWINGEWVVMEIATLFISCVALYFIRFPFIMVLIYSTIWFITMDIVHFFVGIQKDYLDQYSIVSIAIGLLLNVIGFYLYKKRQEDFAFWSYFFGMLLCWTGLTLWDMPTEVEHFIYFLINFAFVILSNFFHRNIFLFFGSLGILCYLSHLVFVFSNSLMFSFVLAAIGFSIILLTTLLLHMRKKIS
jgi:hypothetical protein